MLIRNYLFYLFMFYLFTSIECTKSSVIVWKEITDDGTDSLVGATHIYTLLYSFVLDFKMTRYFKLHHQKQVLHTTNSYSLQKRTQKNCTFFNMGFNNISESNNKQRKHRYKLYLSGFDDTVIT